MATAKNWFPFTAAAAPGLNCAQSGARLKEHQLGNWQSLQSGPNLTKARIKDALYGVTVGGWCECPSSAPSL